MYSGAISIAYLKISKKKWGGGGGGGPGSAPQKGSIDQAKAR